MEQSIHGQRSTKDGKLSHVISAMKKILDDVKESEHYFTIITFNDKVKVKDGLIVPTGQ